MGGAALRAAPLTVPRILTGVDEKEMKNDRIRAPIDLLRAHLG
jgi:hypothetical protein